MIGKMRKIVAVVLMLIQTIVFTLNVSANVNDSKYLLTDAYLLFETWQGSGNSSVCIEDVYIDENFGEFEQVQHIGKEFSTDNYTVTDIDSITTITLKEEFLKTLKDGTYSFDAIFSKVIIPLKLHVVTRKIVMVDAYFTLELREDGAAEANMDSITFSRSFYPELFNGLEYKGDTVDRSNYYISSFTNTTKIILKKDYVKRLPDGEHYFTADFLDVSIGLKLKKGIKKHKVNTQKPICVKKPLKVKRVKAIAKRKKLTIRWKKQKNVTGYIVKIGTNKKITKNKKIVITNKNKNKVHIKGIKSKKKYYIRVRAYKVVKGGKKLGVWSKRLVKK